MNSINKIVPKSALDIEYTLYLMHFLVLFCCDSYIYIEHVTYI